MCKILSRINDIAEHEGISIAAIEKRIGASRGVISKAIKNGTDIQSKWIASICDNFPAYSAEWLLTGEGNMLKDATVQASVPVVHHVTKPDDDAVDLRPRIPFDAAAGALSFGINSVAPSDCEYFPAIPSFPRYDFTIIVRGDSMTPEFQSGDEVACIFVRESSFIQWGRPHILDTAQGIVLKRIFNAPNEIICKSINPDYPEFPVPKDEVYHVALVVGLIRHF